MTVSNTTSRNQYTASSGQTVFPYTFEIYNKDDIVVLQNGVALSEGTDYTVSGVGVNSGGNITFVVAATGGEIITIYRDMALEREADYQNSGDFLAAEVNTDFDRLWLASQQVDEKYTRAIRRPISDSSSLTMELPSSGIRANKYLTFDSLGEVSVSAAIPSGTTIQSGTFNPVYSSSSGSFGIVAYQPICRYVKIGELVYVSLKLNVSGISVGTASGLLYVSGLPFNAAPNETDYGVISYANGWSTPPYSLAIRNGSTSAVANLFKTDGSYILVSDMDLSGANRIVTSFIYRASE